MILAIDIGNSRIKWGVFQEGRLLSFHAVEYSEDTFSTVLENENLPISGNKVMISHVAGEQIKSALTDYLKSKPNAGVEFVETRAEQCQVINSYEDVDKMGVDRWLAMLAAYHSPLRKPDEAVCIIDCGTAITLDLVSEAGVHLGGLIMPGYQTMLDSLLSNTREIQRGVDLESVLDKKALLGASTTACVHLGCAQVVNKGIAGIVDGLLKSTRGSLKCLVTGGDGELIMQGLDAEATLVPQLVLEGLFQVSHETPDSNNKNS